MLGYSVLLYVKLGTHACGPSGLNCALLQCVWSTVLGTAAADMCQFLTLSFRNAELQLTIRVISAGMRREQFLIASRMGFERGLVRFIPYAAG